MCGAQNFEAGDKVPVALVGATLPNGMTIKKAKLRGVESRGHELLGARTRAGRATTTGLMILPADAPVGMPFAEYQGLSDTILELEITPNRPDCLSVRASRARSARCSAEPRRCPRRRPPRRARRSPTRVTVDDRRRRAVPALHRAPHPQRQDRPVARSGSPSGSSRRGARSINNVVDITNYVMFELGQPLHAFDADLLAQGRGGASPSACARARRARS